MPKITFSIEIDTDEMAQRYTDYGHPHPKDIAEFLKEHKEHFGGAMRAAIYNSMGHCMWFNFVTSMEKKNG